MNELHRHGNFSSSEIWKLTKSDRSGNGFGAPALTYIEEKQMERRLGRGLSSDTNSKPTNWGTVVEQFAFNKLGLEFSIVSKDRLQHPKIKNWVGVPDLISEKKVGDIKCPFTLKSFCKLADIIKTGDPKALKDNDGAYDDGFKYYWQLVSNSILTGLDVAVLAVYCPYKSDLDKIREYACSEFEGDINKAAFINWATDDELPWLLDNGYYKDINVLEFEVPKEDKEYLTERVLKANELLTTKS